MLEAARFETYLPLVEQERAWSDRTKRVAFPLFAGYTFARFHEERLTDLVRTPGLVEVVGRERPAPIRADELDAVRLLVAGLRKTHQAPEPLDWLEPGTPVQVMQGPFEGMRGSLLQVRGPTRVAVRLSTIRMAVSVELDRNDLERVV